MVVSPTPPTDSPPPPPAQLCRDHTRPETVTPKMHTIFLYALLMKTTMYLVIDKPSVLTRRVHGLRETDLRGHWRVDFWYLKMKPSAHISVQWAPFYEIW